MQVPFIQKICQIVLKGSFNTLALKLASQSGSLAKILDKGGFLHFNWILFSAAPIILMLEKERTSGA